MQTRFLKIVVVFLLPFCAFAQSSSQKLTKGDSLFRAKQYTQAFVLYQSVMAEKKYTPAMLLKMAYIQEGLGHAGACLYYLNLYHLATGDDQTLGKMEELAQKSQLEGYQTSQQQMARQWWHRNSPSATLFCLGLASLLITWAFVQRKRRGAHTPQAVIACALVVSVLIANNMWGDRAVAIFASPRTYVLDAPSAGGTALDVLGEGHRVEWLDTKDVWAKVMWRDKVAYIKSTQLREVKL